LWPFQRPIQKSKSLAVLSAATAVWLIVVLLVVASLGTLSTK
jgi:hypothetical protein